MLAYVSVRQHTPANVHSVYTHIESGSAGIRQHTSEYASICQHTSAYIWRIYIYIVGFMLAYVSIYVQRISTYSRVYAVPECWCASASLLPTLPSLLRKSLLWVATTYTIPAGFGFMMCLSAGVLVSLASILQSKYYWYKSTCLTSTKV